jgi:hypothetical protein
VSVFVCFGKERGGQWQLAHLAYTAARELPSKDPDLQAHMYLVRMQGRALHV